MNHRRRSESLKPIRACQSAAKRSLAALCVVVALETAPAPALADEPEAVICIDETAAYRQARRDHSDSEDGSLRQKLSAGVFDEAHHALVACVARQEGICGQVGQMLQDLEWENQTELEELWRMHWYCVFTGQPDG